MRCLKHGNDLFSPTQVLSVFAHLYKCQERRPPFDRPCHACPRIALARERGAVSSQIVKKLISWSYLVHEAFAREEHVNICLSDSFINEK